VLVPSTEALPQVHLLRPWARHCCSVVILFLYTQDHAWMHICIQERSCVYEKLLECEELAKGAKRGVHSAKEPPVNRLNDVSAPGNAAK
jgi:hypothetical protein